MVYSNIKARLIAFCYNFYANLPLLFVKRYLISQNFTLKYRLLHVLFLVLATTLALLSALLSECGDILSKEKPYER